MTKKPFHNPYYQYRSAPNRLLADVFKTDSKEKTTKLMNSFPDRWFTSDDPLIIALKQFDIGLDDLVVTPATLRDAVICVLEPDEELSFKEIKDHWCKYFDEVKEKGGERSGQIIRIQTAEEIDAELNQILKINLG